MLQRAIYGSQGKFTGNCVSKPSVLTRAVKPNIKYNPALLCANIFDSGGSVDLINPLKAKQVQCHESLLTWSSTGIRGAPINVERNAVTTGNCGLSVEPDVSCLS